MYAEVEEDACDLVLLPSNITFKGERVVCLLFKATSSTAQGGGGSFKMRKTMGEIGCCESRMSKQKH